MLRFFNFLIRCSFYCLFILIPIIFAGNTSELFEFNKMWIVFGLTLIVGASWISVMLIEKQIKIRRSPLDIPILLFLASQLLSTLFSIDPHTSLWGYYSRFNGGLFSFLSYALLYFAFVSTVAKKDVMKFVYTGIGGAVFVALWGLPSHFGYDPTCLMFRGTLDVSCWTFAFQPKVRIFSTLGQPDWLAAYLVMMIPFTVSLGLIFWKAKNKLLAALFLLLTALFFVDLLYTKARSGFVGFLAAMGVFFLIYVAFSWRSFAKHHILKAVKQHGFFLTTLFLFALFTFFIGSPLSQLDKFSFNGIKSLLAAQKTVDTALAQPKSVATTTASGIPVQEFGGTDSGKIRLFVWKGALDVFLHNPLVGTGVETFGYAYYQYRPAGHNLTSEWDYLYNKAHNEYLNYLATTGIVGFGTYMFLIGMSVWVMAKALTVENRKLKIGVENGQSKIETRNNYSQSSTIKKLSSILDDPSSKILLLVALIASYVSILVTNFFGFSVVVMNVYLFFIPAFALLLMDTISDDHVLLFPKNSKPSEHTSEAAWVGIGIVWIAALYFCIVLIRFWLADVSYALGQNLDHAGQYQAAYSYLHDAVSTRPSEPVFQDELSINDAVLAGALFQQKDTTNGAKLRDEAIAVSDSVTTSHPNVVTFWKSRVRIFYTLAQSDPQYLNQALIAIEKAAALAPTDAKVWYNLGLLYDQTGNVDKAISTLERTIQLKADYRDAYYALALFYRQKAVGTDPNSKVVQNPEAEQKAVATMHLILQNFGPNDDLKLRDTLKTWGEK